LLAPEQLRELRESTLQRSGLTLRCSSWLRLPLCCLRACPDRRRATRLTLRRSRRHALAAHAEALQERVVLRETLLELLRERLPVGHAALPVHAEAEARLAALHGLTLTGSDYTGVAVRCSWWLPPRHPAALLRACPRHLEALSLRLRRGWCRGR